MGTVQESASLRQVRSSSSILALTTLSHMMQHVFAGVAVVYPSIMGDLQLNYTQLGIIVATGSILAGGLQILFSVLSRRVAGGLLLGAGTMMLSVGSAVMGTSASFYHLVASRVATGIGSASQHPIGASMISESYEKKDVGKAFGLHFSGANIGTLGGPILIGSLALALGWRQALLIMAVPPIILGAWVIWYLRGYASSRLPEHRSGNLGKEILAAIRHRGVLMIIVAQGLLAGGTGWGAIVNYSPLFLTHTMKMEAVSMTTVYSLALTGSVVGPFLFGRYSGRFGHIKLASFITVLASVLVFLLTLHTNASLILVVHLFLIGFSAFSIPGLIQSHISSIADKGRRDLVIGLFYTISFTANSAWSTLMGYLIDVYGSFTPSFQLMAGLGLIAALLLFAQTRISREN